MIFKASCRIAVASSIIVYFIPDCLSTTTVVVNGTASHSIPSTLCLRFFLLLHLHADRKVIDGMMFEVCFMSPFAWTLS